MPLPDVVVVGAGIAGLTCAEQLACKGYQVVVLEARERVGGRIRTFRAPGQEPIELGAQVIHGQNAITWSIIRRAGLRTAPWRDAGDLTLEVDGDLYAPEELGRASLLLPWALERRFYQLDLPDLAVQTIVDKTGLDRHSSRIFQEWIAQAWCADPQNLSALGIGQLKRAHEAGDGEFSLPDGYDAIPEHMAARVNVTLNSCVGLVNWKRGQVRVHSDDAIIGAQAAVITVPPAVVAAGHLKFDPPLSERKMRAAGSIVAGDAIACVVHLRKPAPCSGWIFAVSAPGGFWRAREGSRFIAGWVKGPAATRFRELGLSREILPSVLRRIFRWIESQEIDQIWITDWATDPFSLGGYTYPRVGELQEPEVWAASVDQTLFFAGEATSARRHQGMVHGAIESGFRAADEVEHAFCGNKQACL